MNIELEINKYEFRDRLGIKDGKPGAKGDSIKGDPGEPGAKGDDGSPDTPDEVVGKVNLSKKKIKAKQIEGLISLMKEVDDRDKNPVGAPGGGSKYVFKSNGTVVSDHVTEINFTTGITAVYSGNGVITLSASSGTWYQDEIPTNTKNGTNKTFTLAHTPASVVFLYVNGIAQNSNASAPQGADYTRAGVTITMTTAPLSTDNFTCTYS